MFPNRSNRDLKLMRSHWETILNRDQREKKDHISPKEKDSPKPKNAAIEKIENPSPFEVLYPKGFHGLGLILNCREARVGLDSSNGTRCAWQLGR